MTGKYKHFKGNEYEVVGVCENKGAEKFVIYKPLYNDSGYWIRPFDMFFESIERDGEIMKRFSILEEYHIEITMDYINVTDSENLKVLKVFKENNKYIIKD